MQGRSKGCAPRYPPEGPAIISTSNESRHAVATLTANRGHRASPRRIRTSPAHEQWRTSCKWTGTLTLHTATAAPAQRSAAEGHAREKQIVNTGDGSRSRPPERADGNERRRDR